MECYFDLDSRNYIYSLGIRTGQRAKKSWTFQNKKRVRRRSCFSLSKSSSDMGQFVVFLKHPYCHTTPLMCVCIHMGGHGFSHVKGVCNTNPILPRIRKKKSRTQRTFLLVALPLVWEYAYCVIIFLHIRTTLSLFHAHVVLALHFQSW